MISKKHFFVLLLLIGIISLSAVSAEEDMARDVVGTNANDGLFLEESIPEDVSNINDKEIILEDSNEGMDLGQSDENPENEDTLSESNEETGDTVTARNYGNENISESSDSVMFNIEKRGSSITIKPIEDSTYGNEITVEFTGENLTVVQIMVLNKNDKVVFTNYTTENSVTIPVLSAGEYTVTATNLGDENISYSFDSEQFSIEPLKTNLTITLSSTSINYGGSVTATFNIFSEGGWSFDGDQIEIEYNNQKENLTVTDGKATKVFEKPSAGSYDLLAKYVGNENITGSMSRSKFTVVRLATQIDYKDMVTTAVDTATDGRVGEYFKVTLKDINGNVLANKAIQIGFNGKTYNRTTNATGEAKLQINLERYDIYTFAIAFLGDENYTGSFAVAKITVNKQKGSLTVPNKSYKATAKTKTITATFKAASGKVVANKKVSFTVNGKTYSATTNSKGVASVNVSLTKKGSYKITAKYAGDGCYATMTKTATLKLS